MCEQKKDLNIIKLKIRASWNAKLSRSRFCSISHFPMKSSFDPAGHHGHDCPHSLLTAQDVPHVLQGELPGPHISPLEEFSWNTEGCC